MNKGILFGLILMLMTTACTNKKNPVGISGQEGPVPVETVIGHEHFKPCYSFEDSIRNYNSDNLLIGSYFSNNFQNKAATLLKFTSLVDSFYSIENVRLILRINDNYNFDVIDNTTLKVGKIISSDWFETTATWLEPTDSTSWFNAGSFSFLDGQDLEKLNDLEMEVTGDSLSIFLPENILADWILADSLNFGLALFTEDDDKFIEFYAEEYSAEYSPKLYFDYRETEEDTLVTEYRKPNHDILIYDTDDVYQVFAKKLITSNIQPVRMLIRFDIPATIFTDFDNFNPAIEDTILYLQRLTINRAELILSFESNTLYPIETTMNLDPYIVISDSTEWNWTDPTVPLLSSENYEDPYISSVSDSLNSTAFAVNITRIMQNLVSGEKENYGIMIRSLYENRDFRHTEFSIQPEINIIFTPPYFGD